MTPREFVATQKAYIERERRQWELARYSGYLSILPHTDKKKRLKISDLGLFPWEKQVLPIAKPASEEFKRAADAIIAAKYNKQNGNNSGT